VDQPRLAYFHSLIQPGKQQTIELTDFSLRLRDDFQFACPVWLSPFPHSLTVLANLLVLFTAFQDIQVIAMKF